MATKRLKKRVLSNKQQAMEFCNDLVGYFMTEDPKSIVISYGFGELRRIPQNSYWWAALGMGIKHFEKTPLDLVNFIEKSLDADFLTPTFLHELCKMRYLKDTTTTNKDTKVFSKLTNDFRHDMLHDYNFDIPPPPIKGYDNDR